MPRDRRYHGGGGRVDLTDLIMGIGEASAPTTENPFYGMKPGDVPFDKKVDPSALVSKPFTGFLSSRENTQAAQERLALQERTKADQIRRTQIIAENMAEEGRQLELGRQAGNLARQAFLNAKYQNDPTHPDLFDPRARGVLFGSRGGVEGMVGSSPRLEATIGGLPTMRAAAAAEGQRGLTEAEAYLNAAAANPGMIQDAYLAGQQKPVIINKAAQQEIDMRNAGKFAWGRTPIPVLTQIGPNEFIAPTPETHGGYQPTGIDEKGNPTGFGFVPPRASMPSRVVQLPDGTLVTQGGAKPAAKTSTTPPPSASPPPLTPSPGISYFAPPLSLTPSSSAPFQARGPIPSLLNSWADSIGQEQLNRQTELETMDAEKAIARPPLQQLWYGPNPYPDPVIHPPVPMKRKGLQPRY